MDLPGDVPRLLESRYVGGRGDRDGQPLLAGVVLEGDVQGPVLGERLRLIGCRELEAVLSEGETRSVGLSKPPLACTAFQ